MGFQLGSLPFRYLRVPVILARLRKADCVALVNAIIARIQSWTHRFLSFAGRLQLVKSVLHSIQVFWASVFFLPCSVIDRIEQIFCQFLWKGPLMGSGGAKVSWSDICLPREEGGLGIRTLRENNIACMLKHIWILFLDKESLWCKWIHSTFLKRKNFWIVPCPTFCFWAWRKLLGLRDHFQQHFKWIIGDGRSTSFWFDPWHPQGPLNRVFSNHDIYRSGIPCLAAVADGFSSLLGWYILNILAGWWDPIPVLNAEKDKFQWIRHRSRRFSIASAWDLFPPRGNPIWWSSFIWNFALSPRYRTHLWLTSCNRLPTQVLLISYGRIAHTTCPFCSCRLDSVDHLFFACHISGSLASF